MLHKKMKTIPDAVIDMILAIARKNRRRKSRYGEDFKKAILSKWMHRKLNRKYEVKGIKFKTVKI